MPAPPAGWVVVVVVVVVVAVVVVFMFPPSLFPFPIPDASARRGFEVVVEVAVVEAVDTP